MLRPTIQIDAIVYQIFLRSHVLIPNYDVFISLKIGFTLKNSAALMKCRICSITTGSSLFVGVSGIQEVKWTNGLPSVDSKSKLPYPVHICASVFDIQILLSMGSNVSDRASGFFSRLVGRSDPWGKKWWAIF